MTVIVSTIIIVWVARLYNICLDTIALFLWSIIIGEIA